MSGDFWKDMDIIKLINNKKNKGIFYKDTPLFDVDAIAASADLATMRAADTKSTADSGFMNFFYFTSNFCMYTVEKNKTGKEEFLYFGQREANPIFNNFEESCMQLQDNENYRLTREEVKKVYGSVKTGHTHRVRLASLKLREFDQEFAFFEIDTRYYWQTVKNGGLNKPQREFAEKVFGVGKDFNRYMYLLTFRSIRKTRIYVLNPKYIREHHKTGTAIARMCLLCDYYYSSNFYANIRGIDMVDVLMGVLRKRNSTIDAACLKLVESPDETLEIMRTNPVMASALVDICNTYERRKNR
jgi:hypothetical protein